MALVVLVRSVPKGAPLSITLDAPRIVIGRSPGCEVRLPDPSVSARHASLRQRGAEYLLVDEGSTNGTFFGPLRLGPQTPRVLKTGDRFRVGRVWLEVRYEPRLVTESPRVAALEAALELVTRGLEAEGEPAGARVTVEAGRDAGRELPLGEAGRLYVLGRAPSSDLALEDAAVPRRALGLRRVGAQVWLRDLGEPAGAARLGRDPVGREESPWPPGAELTLGAARLSLSFPAAEALAELERMPDEPMAEDEDVPEPGAPDEPDEPPAESAESAGSEPAAAPPEASAAAPSPPPDADLDEDDEEEERPARTWGATDALVALAALAVLAVSVLGFFWLLRAR